jgi:hypothetical protein
LHIHKKFLYLISNSQLRLNVTLTTDKDVYSPNDKIIGKVEYTKPGWGIHVRGLKIIAQGAEKTEITETRVVTVPVPTPPRPPVDSDGDGTPDNTSTPVDADGDGTPDNPSTTPATTTETQTIPHYDSEIFFSKQVDLEVKSPVSFELQLPGDLKGSYSGKHATIDYHVQATADVIGINPSATKEFKVTVGSKQVPSGTKLFMNARNGVVEAVTEVNSNIFSPGDTVSGNIKLSNLQSTNIQRAEITLRGMEFATADNMSETSVIEEHKTSINWNSTTTGSFSLQIPASAKKSYTGRYSKYYWEILEDLVTGFSTSDIHIKDNIEIQ